MKGESMIGTAIGCFLFLLLLILVFGIIVAGIYIEVKHNAECREYGYDYAALRGLSVVCESIDRMPLAELRGGNK